MNKTYQESEVFWNRVRLRQTVRDMALLFVVVGFLAALAALVALLRAQAVETWPTVPGVVTSSGLETRPIAGRMARSESVAVIAYRYEVDEQTFTSQTVTQGAPPVRAGTDEAERLLTSYFEGAPVTVFYNPNDPSVAVLEQAVPEGTLNWLLLSFGIALVFALLAMLLRPR